MCISSLSDSFEAMKNKNHDTVDIFKKTLRICKEKGLIDFANWIESELKGYPIDNIPQYRYSFADIQCSLDGKFWINIRYDDFRMELLLRNKPFNESLSLIQDYSKIADNEAVILPFSDSNTNLIKQFDDGRFPDIMYRGVIPSRVFKKVLAAIELEFMEKVALYNNITKIQNFNQISIESINEVSKFNPDNSKDRVFISYCHEDQNEVEKFVNTLIKNKVNVMVDFKSWELGSDIPQNMEQNINAAKSIIVVCSKSYKKKADRRSDGVGYEAGLISACKLSNKDKKIIPVKLDNSLSWKDCLPNFIVNNDGICIDENSKEYQDNIDKLIRSM